MLIQDYSLFNMKSKIQIRIISGFFVKHFFFKHLSTCSNGRIRIVQDTRSYTSKQRDNYTYKKILR